MVSKPETMNSCARLYTAYDWPTRTSTCTPLYQKQQLILFPGFITFPSISLHYCCNPGWKAASVFGVTFNYISGQHITASSVHPQSILFSLEVVPLQLSHQLQGIKQTFTGPGYCINSAQIEAVMAELVTPCVLVGKTRYRQFYSSKIVNLRKKHLTITKLKFCVNVCVSMWSILIHYPQNFQSLVAMTPQTLDE